jgi:multidrug efflux pump
VAWCVKRRWLVIGLTVALFALSIFGMGKVQKQFFPNSTRLELNVELRLPEGASVTATMPKPNGLRNGSTRTRPNSTSSSITSPTSAAGSPRYYLGLDQQLPASNVSQFVI